MRRGGNAGDRYGQRLEEGDNATLIALRLTMQIYRSRAGKEHFLLSPHLCHLTATTQALHLPAQSCASDREVQTNGERIE
jgi:hypothetical protein